MLCVGYVVAAIWFENVMCMGARLVMYRLIVLCVGRGCYVCGRKDGDVHVDRVVFPHEDRRTSPREVAIHNSSMSTAPLIETLGS